MQIIRSSKKCLQTVQKLRFISLFMAVICLFCLALPAAAKPCSTCGGTGTDPSCSYVGNYGGDTAEEYCSVCRGYKRLHYHKSCYACNGSGNITTCEEIFDARRSGSSNNGGYSWPSAPAGSLNSSRTVKTLQTKRYGTLVDFGDSYQKPFVQCPRCYSNYGTMSINKINGSTTIFCMRCGLSAAGIYSWSTGEINWHR